jgi:Domain of unknown function (DUF1772)
MSIKIIRFCTILLSGLIAGTLSGIWIGYNPHSLSAVSYLEQQQNAINALNTLMPVLGLITIILTVTSAWLQKNNKPIMGTLLTAVVLLIIAGLTTRFGNQPINKIVMEWGTTTIPANWMSLRDKWWLFHIVRSVLSIVAFCLVTWANMQENTVQPG